MIKYKTSICETLTTVANKNFFSIISLNDYMSSVSWK